MSEKRNTSDSAPNDSEQAVQAEARLGGWSAPAKLTVQTTAGVTRVFVDAVVVARFPKTDTGARNLAMVSLAEGGSFTRAAITAAFGLTPGRLSQLRKRFREGGAAALSARRGPPRGQRTLSAKQVERVRSLRREGLTIDAITRLMNKKRIRVGRSTIARLVKGVAPRATSDLPLGERTEGDGRGLVANAVVDLVDAEPAAASEAVENLGPKSVDAEIVSTTVETAAVARVASGDDAGPSNAETVVAAEQAVETNVATAATQTSESVPVRPASSLALREGETWSCGVAGAMVAHVAFEALGLRKALAASGASLRPAKTFDLLRTAGVLVFGVLLRFRSVESLRMLVRRDFGRLLGLRRAPEIRTVRRKLAELSKPETGFCGTRLMRGLATELLRESAVPEGVYFFDDHFVRYHGKQPFGRGWDAKSRLGAPGREDVYVHDLRGRAILFVPLPAPTSLSKAMPHALRELRAIQAVPRLAVFDRGGWSKDLFRTLLNPEDGSGRIDFLTYLTARNKPRELPRDSFQAVQVEEAGRVHRYEVAELPLKLAGLDEPLRVIVLRDPKKDRQIPILTSDPNIAPGKAVHLLRARWRQENSFKYLVGELSIDALVDRDVDLAADDRFVENPERKEIKRELTKARAVLAKHDKALSAALLVNKSARRPTVRGFKIANSELVRLQKEAADRVSVIEEDLAGTPAKVPLIQLDPQAQRATERAQRRLFVGGLKLLVHNAEKWLAERMGPGPYGRDALPILRALTNQSGRLRREADRLVVEIRPLDTPRYQRHVNQLLQTLNARKATFLDSGLQLEFRILDPCAEAACHVL